MAVFVFGADHVIYIYTKCVKCLPFHQKAEILHIWKIQVYIIYIFRDPWKSEVFDSNLMAIYSFQIGIRIGQVLIVV